MRRNHSAGFVLGLIAVLAVVGGAVALAGHDKGNVDELRFGTEIDAEGVVPVESHGTHFVPDTKIYVSMQVQEAVKDTQLMLSIFDRETEKLVWSESQSVPGGHANMQFLIPSGGLVPGKYRAKVKLGNDWVAEHEFKIE